MNKDMPNVGTVGHIDYGASEREHNKAAKCPTCGTQCGVYSSGEGTNSFIPPTEPLYPIADVVKMLLENFDVVYHGQAGELYQPESDEILLHMMQIEKARKLVKG